MVHAHLGPSESLDLLDSICPQVLLVAIPGAEGHQAVDASGEAALGVLRALGLPSIVVAVQGGGAGKGTSGPVGMKERSAAKKRAEKAMSAHVGPKSALRFGLYARRNQPQHTHKRSSPLCLP